MWQATFRLRGQDWGWLWLDLVEISVLRPSARGSGPFARSWCGKWFTAPRPRAPELGTVSREDGLSPWPAWPVGAAMGSYGPLWAAMGRYGPLWAAMGRYGPQWAAMGRYGPLGPKGPLGRARLSDPTYTQFPEGILRTPE